MPYDFAMSPAPEQLATQLISFFEEINAQHFDGMLPRPILRWNARLRTSAGRFIPGAKRFLHVREPIIEVASYLLEEGTAEALVRDTLGHEAIHFWLWVRGRPYGHTEEFYAKMREMGVSRYNSVPRRRPPKYLYRCPGCGGEYPARRRLRELACLRCCKAHAGGRYDVRFKLVIVQGG